MIQKIATREMTEQEWVDSRKGSIGGSDAAAIVGLNPWKSAYALWAEKSGKVEPEDISMKEAVRLGHELEPYVAKRFTEITGKKVRRENFTLKNDLYPWAHANVDRMVIGEKAGLECKTTSALALSKFRSGEYPANYYAQCVHYLAVTGLDRWYLCVLIGNQEVRVFTIERDEDEIEALMDSEREFWAGVESGEAPLPDGSESSSNTLSRLYQDEGGECDLTPFAGTLREYVELKAQVKDLTAKCDGLANQIKEYMGTASRGSAGDFRVTYGSQTRRTFDKKAFSKDNPGFDLSNWEKVNTSRVFNVKGA